MKIEIDELARQFTETYGVSDPQPIVGDASTRQYWRTNDSVIMVDRGEGARRRLDTFVDVASRLATVGIIVPAIRVDDRENGVLILEDLGERPLSQNINEANSRDAVSLLHIMQSTDHEGLPVFGQEILTEELSRLNRFYLEPMGIKDGDLAAITADLIEETAFAAQVFVHVDYHADNLLLVERGIGVIDFQDARVGHPLYDLASFVDDVRRQVDPREREKLIGFYFNNAPTTQQVRDIEWLSAQRLLKIIGIFSRLYAEGRTKYGDLLPQCFALLDLRLAHPELHTLREWFYDVVPPWEGDRFTNAINNTDS